ncbi:GNAT family N-acetyltransferase [uncultured Treponema sp.]|uniref:GNAT family N-acetyltransferase n=1 Tax=uncultured Treponema sp. TaxID=162155 RepID=UPI0025CE1D67|nr:GNAT family N-acetyltransferase [uncultured Treponema sp.]
MLDVIYSAWQIGFFTSINLHEQKGNIAEMADSDIIGIKYRLGKLEDIETITALIQEAIKEMEKHDIFQWDELYPTAEDFEADIRKGNLYVAEENGKIIALYMISGESDEAYNNAEWKYPRETSLVLHRFCVSPGFQNKGIGKKVLNKIESQIKSMGYDSVRLDVFTKNPYAQKLYRNNGYEVRGFAEWRKGRFDLMEKKL